MSSRFCELKNNIFPSVRSKEGKVSSEHNPTIPAIGNLKLVWVSVSLTETTDIMHYLKMFFGGKDSTGARAEDRTGELPADITSMFCKGREGKVADVL